MLCFQTWDILPHNQLVQYILPLFVNSSFLPPLFYFIFFGMAPRLSRIDCPFRRCFSSTVFVSRLSFYTTEEKLRDSFSPFGSIKTVRLIQDRQTHRPKGFGFVEFHYETDALRALKAMNYKMIDGRLLILEMAKSDKDDN